MDRFQEEVNGILSRIGTDHLKYNREEAWMYQHTYEFIQNYAVEKQLLNTAIALPVVRSLHDGTYRGVRRAADGTRWRRPYFCHSLSVCRMLINLGLPLTQEEEDIALAAALCHDLKVHVPFRDGGNEMHTIYHLDPRVVEIMMLIYEGNCENEDDYLKVFEGVQKNKLALLVRLSDRGNIVEELYTVSVWKAHELIYETRTFYMPMCIYAREHFPELDAPVGLLQEKMRDLIEATEMFVNRYEQHEKELSEKILLLQEENARMRSLIRKKKAERESEE